MSCEQSRYFFYICRYCPNSPLLSQLLSQWPPLGGINDLENEFQKFIRSFLILENVGEKLEDGPTTGSSFERPFFWLMFVKICFCMILSKWDIHARFAKKIANSSQLILSQILVEMKRNCESGDLLI